MAEQVIKEIIPFTQDEIETEVRAMLLSKGLTDILYPGSNVSQISDVMTYLIHVLNTNTAINLQEVILPLATKRMNVLFGARQLGYEATQKVSFQYKLNINIKENTDVIDRNTPYKVILPRFTKFISNGNSYWYLGDSIEIGGDANNPLTNANRFDHSFDIIVKEGDYIQYDDNELLRFRTFNEIAPNGDVIPKQSYLIPFKDIEQDGIDMFLTYVDEYGTDVIKEYWERSDQLLIDSTFEYNQRRYIRLQNLFLQMPTVFFEIGGYGNPVRLNTLIEMNIMISSGSAGVSGDEFKFDDSYMSSLFSATPTETVKRGRDEEATESIKENAPIVNNSASRAVTALDYIAISQRHPSVKYAKCWGIENEYDQSRSSAAIFLSYTPERTVREFKSTDPDNISCSGSVGSVAGGDGSCNLSDDSGFILNARYDLQSMPRHPIIVAQTNPADNKLLFPQQVVPTAPDFVPRPVNYLPEPFGWTDAEQILKNKPLPRFNPGNAPSPVTQLERDTWMLINEPGIDKMPQDWVEDPNINKWYIDIDSGLDAGLPATGIGLRTNLPEVIDFSDPDELGTPQAPPAAPYIYVNFSDERLDLIKRQEEIEYYRHYKTKADTTWTQELEDANRRWYSSTLINGGSYGGTISGGTVIDEGEVYKDWLYTAAVNTAIKWAADDYVFRVYEIDLRTWENASLTYADYNNYLNTKEGKEYNEYWNALGVVSTPVSTWRLSESSRDDLGLPPTGDYYGPVDISPGDIVAFDELITTPAGGFVQQGEGLATGTVGFYYKALVLFDNQPLNDINYDDANDWEVVAENDVGFRQFQDSSYLDFEVAANEFRIYSEEVNKSVTNWYLDDNEVYNMPNPPLPPARDTNVFTVLDTFKIMTMKLNQRQPAYMNFNFEIKILKYDISQTIASINERVFNVVDEYFRDYIERFDVEYFASNTQRRIDGVLGDGTGVEVNLTNDISISRNMYDTSSILNFDVIKFRLSFPFENLYNEATAELDARKFLPSIDTPYFSTTDTATTGDTLLFNIEAGDTVFYQRESTGTSVASGPGIVGNYYRSEIDRGFIDINNTPFEYRPWVNISNQAHNTSEAITVDVVIDDVILDDSDRQGTGTGNNRYVSLIDQNIDLSVSAPFSDSSKWLAVGSITNIGTDFDYCMQGITNQPTPVECDGVTPDVRFDADGAETPQDILIGTKVYYGAPAQGPNGGGTVGAAYVSMVNRGTGGLPKVNLNDTDFDYTPWTNITNMGSLTSHQDLYIRRLSADGNPLNIPPFVDGVYDFDPLDFPYDVRIPGVGGIEETPTAQTADIVLDIHLGDINNAFMSRDDNTDPVVGRYIIRNAQHQFIDIELYFGEVSTTGIANLAIDAGKTFTDAGFGYVDITYPSNIDAGSDNIPFTGYTMPRLRQVRFLKD